MNKLNQYIGGIVSSITNARSMCDMQTAELARQYSGHELLKHFSVPRMRIEDIEMTIPVAMNAPNPGDFEMFDKPRLTSAVIDTAINFIGLKKEQRNKFKDASYSTITKYAYELRSTDNIEAYSRNVATYAIKLSNSIRQDFTAIDVDAAPVSDRIRQDFTVIAIEAPAPDPIKEDFRAINRQEALASQIKEVVKTTLASDATLLGDTNVVIEASQLREIPRDNLIYIKMKIREEGMEWAISENKEGEVQSALLPE